MESPRADQALARALNKAIEERARRAVPLSEQVEQELRDGPDHQVDPAILDEWLCEVRLTMDFNASRGAAILDIGPPLTPGDSHAQASRLLAHSYWRWRLHRAQLGLKSALAVKQCQSCNRWYAHESAPKNDSQTCSNDCHKARQNDRQKDHRAKKRRETRD